MNLLLLLMNVMYNMLSLHPQTAAVRIRYSAPSDSRPHTAPPRAPHK
jgi:hypothetical protein